MATPIKPNIGTKEDYASRPSVPSNKKQGATEYNLLVSAVVANYDRLLLRWATDIVANVALLAGQYVVYIDGITYRIVTGYNVGNPITWDSSKAVRVTAQHLRGAYDLSITNDYPENGTGSAENGDLVYGDEFYTSEAGTLDLGDGDPTDINVGAILKYIAGDPTLPSSWKVIQ